MFELVLAVVMATLISAFCSVSEAVFYSFSWSRIEKLTKAGSKAGKILGLLRSNIEKPITAILTLNTVANTAGASIAGAAWTSVYGADTLPWFAMGFTIIILIFSEILPKTIGVEYNEKLGPVLASPIKWMVVVFSPVIWVCGFMARSVSSGNSEPKTTEEDIRAIVSLTRKSGAIKPYEALSIANILSLDDKVVDQIMTPRTVVFSLPVDMTVGEAHAKYSAWPHSRIPVYEGDDPEDVVGVIYRRSVFEALADGLHDVTLADLMNPVRFVLDNISLDRLLVKFLESRMHLFVVLDEYGGMAGVVTLEDVMEEILGSEIVDETDQVVDMRELARIRRQELLACQTGDKKEKS
ncbi:hemolysin family protein [Maridesulfovibrio bastinii]|uniref:hemolysin family protein n=1 Tax=Maridesulfovibrio bastinii TaxID=47157 RepID=UPI0004895A7B|nr:hemolysin family protein [Maridesulfovibrio bastinii]